MHDDESGQVGKASEELAAGVAAAEESWFAEIVEHAAKRLAREDAGPDLPPLSSYAWGRRAGERHVDLDAPLFGRPTRDTRDLLRRGESFGVHLRDARRALNADADDHVVAHMDALVGALLVEPPSCRRSFGSDSEDAAHVHGEACRWELTPKGRTLARSSGRTPSTRKAADALARKVVKAAQEVNANPDATMWWVKSIRAVGDYADPLLDSLLHVDLAVELRPRLDDPSEQKKAVLRLGDAQGDRGARGKDYYGAFEDHYLTYRALAGRSAVVRLFKMLDSVTGALLFEETRDLTVKAKATPKYEVPGEPTQRNTCSWCKKRSKSERVARRGEPVSTSPVALCARCKELSYFSGASWIIDEVRAELLEAPFHAQGCALCGFSQASRKPWRLQARGRRPEESVELALCDVCPGLLHLADRPDNGRDEWLYAYVSACHEGMSQRLGLVPDLGKGAGGRRPKLPRLTDVHNELLAVVRKTGCLSACDLEERSVLSRDSNWWATRLRHLQAHGLVVALQAGEARYPSRVRATDDEEQALRRKRDAMFIPGPRWTGECVSDPEPPAEWAALNVTLGRLASERDQQALRTLHQAGLAHVEAAYGSLADNW